MSAKSGAKSSGRASGRSRIASRRRRLALGAGLILIAAAALVVFISSGGGSESGDGEVAASLPVGAAIEMESGPIESGKAFPGFTVTDPGGEVLATKGSLNGKPTIIWFTTSYCLPCQAGAEEVARLDDELGGEAFNVVVAFVDPQEPSSTLEAWRKQFGRPDWVVSIDRGAAFAQALGVRALDTKLLLSADGVLEDVNAYQVDDSYLSLLRRTIQA